MHSFQKALEMMGRKGGSPNSPLVGKASWCTLSKLGPEDEVEAFLETFEQTLEAAQWPKEQWAYILGPYLTGEAQAAVKVLPKQDAGKYQVVKDAILNRFEITPETSRSSGI